MIDYADKFQIIHDMITGILPSSFLFLITAFLLSGILIRFIKYLK